MMNYQKGRNVEQELTRTDIQIENLPENFLWMHVSRPGFRAIFFFESTNSYIINN